MIAALVIAGFMLFWVAVFIAVIKMSGWYRLAELFRLTGEFEGERWWFKSAGMNIVSFKNCIIFGSSRKGLYIGCIVPIGFDTLLIPWTDIYVDEEQNYSFSIPILRLYKLPDFRIRIPNRVMWDKILESPYTPMEFKNSVRGTDAGRGRVD